MLNGSIVSTSKVSAWSFVYLVQQKRKSNYSGCQNFFHVVIFVTVFAHQLSGSNITGGTLSFASFGSTFCETEGNFILMTMKIIWRTNVGSLVNIGKYLSIRFVVTVFRFFFGFVKRWEKCRVDPRKEWIDWKRFKINNRKIEPWFLDAGRTRQYTRGGRAASPSFNAIKEKLAVALKLEGWLHKAGVRARGVTFATIFSLTFRFNHADN